MSTAGATQIWFADDWIVVAEKPADLLAVPGRGEAGRE
ncbi:MAG: RNA pseudouridine synthase, partial [Rubrivivax sp.]|nr:RNA pseudouridine synthase [Rubrivivax sp.]